MTVNSSHQVNFGSRLVMSAGVNLSKKIDRAKLAEDFAKKTSTLNNTFVVYDTKTRGIGVCADIDGKYADSLSDLKIKKITNQDVLLDKLVRAYKMLVSGYQLDNAKDATSRKVIASWIKEFAGQDKDLNRNIAGIVVGR